MKKEPCPHCLRRKNICEQQLSKYEWFYRCTNCGLSGPIEVTKEEAIAAWNALPRRLRWTREKPKEDGFYWCRFRHPNVLQQLIAMVLVNAKGRYGITVGSSDAHDIDSYDGEWAWPLPEPEEP